MKIVKNNEKNCYLIVKNDGTPVVLTCSEAGLLVNFIGKETLRDQIDDRVLTAEFDWLDLSKYNGTREEFIYEIYEELEEEIDYGNSVSEDEIDDRIGNLACFYELEKE